MDIIKYINSYAKSRKIDNEYKIYTNDFWVNDRGEEESPTNTEFIIMCDGSDFKELAYGRYSETFKKNLAKKGYSLCYGACWYHYLIKIK